MAPNIWYYPPTDDIDENSGRRSAPPHPPGVTFGRLDAGLRNRSATKTPQPVVERHKEVNNFLFGMKKWKGTLTRRPLEERSDVVRSLYAPVTISPTSGKSNRSAHASTGNVLYTVLFGWWLAGIYIFLGAIMWMTLIAQDYTSLCWDLAS